MIPYSKLTGSFFLKTQRQIANVKIYFCKASVRASVGNNKKDKNGFLSLLFSSRHLGMYEEERTGGVELAGWERRERQGHIRRLGSPCTGLA